MAEDHPIASDHPALPLRQVLAANPSAMTGPGTTTFLLGRGAVTVIDPGPDDPAHRAAILAALHPGERIVAILITHPHLDHSAGAPALSRATAAPTLGHGPAGSARTGLMAELVAAGLTGGGEGSDTAFLPDQRLQDGARLQLGDEVLEVLHTPGHMAEHLAFAWRGQLFCGDLVMGWAPSLVSPPDGDMAAYMASLRRLAGLGFARLWPTHGPAITDPPARLAALIAHREARRAQVLAALEEGPAALPALTARVYHDTAPALWPAASRNLLAHLIELISEGRVRAKPWPGTQAVFAAV